MTSYMHTVNTLHILRPLFAIQVEQNIDFINKKRDEISFSPNDQQAAESFLQGLFPFLFPF